MACVLFSFRKILVLALLCASCFLQSTQSAHAKTEPGVAGTLSIIPGLGQITNGDVAEGTAWFVVTIGLFAQKNAFLNAVGFKLWMYNMYDAYRDAGAKGAAQHNVVENYIANINPLNIIDPIGASIVGFGGLSKGTAGRNPGTPNGFVLRSVYYGFTGMGEEALFRGFLFPGLSSVFSTKIVGGLLSSAIFSAAHGQFGGAFVTRFIAGLLFCWQVDRNDYDLRKNIFAHTWYDVLVTRNGKVEGSINFKFNF